MASTAIKLIMAKNRPNVLTPPAPDSADLVLPLLGRLPTGWFGYADGGEGMGGPITFWDPALTAASQCGP